MLNTGLKIAVLFLLALPSAFSGNLSFSVKSQSDFGLQSADVSWKICRFRPYANLDLFSISIKGEYKDTDWDSWNSDSGAYILPMHREYVSDFKGEGSATIVLPTLGLRYDFSDKALCPYIYGNIFKALAILNAEYSDKSKSYYENGVLRRERTETSKDGKFTYEVVNYNPDGTVYFKDIYEDDESVYFKAVKRALQPWGLGFGFGTIYRINEHVSVFGEYGIKMYFISAGLEDASAADGDGDGKDDWKSEWSQEMSASIKWLASSVGICYTF